MIFIWNWKISSKMKQWKSSRFFRSQNVTEEEAIDFWREPATNHVLCVIDRREQINIIQSLLRTFWSKQGNCKSYFCDLVENIYLQCFSAKCEIFLREWRRKNCILIWQKNLLRFCNTKVNFSCVIT